MARFSFLFTAVLLLACSNSVETRKQRFLIQGNDMISQRDGPQAERFFQEAIKLDSCFADALNNLGTLYYSEKKYDLAISFYDRAVACHPEFTGTYFNRANAFYELNEMYNALKDLDVVASRKPDTSVLYFSRGLVYTKLREYDKVLRCSLLLYRCLLLSRSCFALSLRYSTNKCKVPCCRSLSS